MYFIRCWNFCCVWFYFASHSDTLFMCDNSSTCCQYHFLLLLSIKYPTEPTQKIGQIVNYYSFTYSSPTGLGARKIRISRISSRHKRRGCNNIYIFVYVCEFIYLCVSAYFFIYIYIYISVCVLNSLSKDFLF